MKRQCSICESWFTPEDVGLNPDDKKHMVAFSRRTICEKYTCVVKRRRKHRHTSFAAKQNKFSGRACDICQKLFFPADYNLDMRSLEGKNTWARLKRCTSEACHLEASERLKEKHRKGPKKNSEELDNSLLASEIIGLRNKTFDTFTEASSERFLQYRRMMGKRL